MTERMNVSVTCPQCGTESTTEVWTSVNSADNPDEAQWLIDGFLFEHECPECGNAITLNHNCLYHNPGRKAMVLYLARPQNVDQAETALEKHRAAGYRARIVPSRLVLREKAAMLRDGLDDRGVELVKFLVFNKFVEEGAIDSRHTAYYGALAEDGGIIVEFIAAGCEPQETVVPRDVYDNAVQQIDALAVEDAQPFLVDRPWAAKTYELLQ